MQYKNGRLHRGRTISVEPVWQTAHLRKQANGMSPVTYQPGQSERPAPFTVIHGHDDSDTLRSTSTDQATPDATGKAAPDLTEQPELRSPLALPQDQNSTNGHSSTSTSTKQQASGSMDHSVIQGPFTLTHFTLAHPLNTTNGHGYTSSKQEASGPTEKPEMRAQSNLAHGQNNINGHGSTSKKRDAPDPIGQPVRRAAFPLTRVQNNTNDYHSALTKQDASGSIDKPTMYARVPSTHDQNSTNGYNSGPTIQHASNSANQSATNPKKETENRNLLAATNDKDESDAYSSTSRSQAAPDSVVLTHGQTSISPIHTPNDSDTHCFASTNGPTSGKTNRNAPDPTDQATPGSPEIHLAAVAYAKLFSATAEPENMSAENAPAQSPDSNHQAFIQGPNPVEEPRILTPRTPLRQVIGPKKDREDLNSSPRHLPSPRIDLKAANKQDRKDFASLRPRSKR